jgi:hypothetical protein
MDANALAIRCQLQQLLASLQAGRHKDVMILSIQFFNHN